ncbi:hypothetical protein D3C85_1397970 [compost metagenome]
MHHARGIGLHPFVIHGLIMGFLAQAFGAENGQRLICGSDDKREGFDIGRCAKLAFVIHTHHRKIAHATKARHQFVFQFEDHGICSALWCHPLRHTAHDLVAGAAFH